MQGRIASKNHVERGVLSGLDILSPRINHYILCAKACRELPDVSQTSGRKNMSFAFSLSHNRTQRRLKLRQLLSCQKG